MDFDTSSSSFTDNLPIPSIWFAAYSIQMTETTKLNFLMKTTTFKLVFSNCASICLETMKMGLHLKGSLETCVHQLPSMNHLRTIPVMVCVQILYPEIYYIINYKCSCEIIMWNSLTFRDAYFCLCTCVIYRHNQVKTLKQNLNNSAVIAFLMEVNCVLSV